MVQGVEHCEETLRNLLANTGNSFTYLGAKLVADRLGVQIRSDLGRDLHACSHDLFQA